MSEEDFLYHVTYHGNLEAIAKQGLRSGGGQSIGQFGAYASHSKARLFCCDYDRVAAWYHRAEEFSEHHYDSIPEDKVPIALRFPLTPLLERGLMSDPEGLQGDYFIPKGTVSARRLEAFTGHGWLPISEWESIDPSAALVSYDDDEDRDEPSMGFRADSPLCPKF